MMELSKNLVCVCIRNSVEIWMESERAENLMTILETPSAPQFIRYDGRMINRADIVGIFNAEDMANTTRRKNGGWQCVRARWHGKGEKCECLSKDEEEAARRRSRAIEECGKCTSGFVQLENGSMAYCECQKGVV